MRLLYKLVEAAAAVTALIILLASEPVTHWAEENADLLLAAVVLLFATNVALAAEWWVARRRIPIAPAPREPTVRDRLLFERFEKEFPRDQGAIAYLRDSFHGKKWHWPQMQTVLSFADGWGRTEFFDDIEMEEARKAFWAAAHEFYSDAATESHCPDDSNPRDRWAVLSDSLVRPQYSPEWTIVRERLMDEAGAVVNAWEQLYRLGRQRGL